jgi:hypothetical protein
MSQETLAVLAHATWYGIDFADIADQFSMQSNDDAARWYKLGAWIDDRIKSELGVARIAPGTVCRPFDIHTAVSAFAKLAEATDALPYGTAGGKARDAIAAAMATIADQIRLFYTTSHTINSTAQG